MDVITQVYLIIGGFMVFSLGLVILIISGKSIFFDFYRRLRPKGCDIFVVNSNRQVSHFYKVPKDGVILINKKTYITNPDKVMSLSDDMKKQVQESLTNKKAKLEARIDEFVTKIKATEKQIEELSKDAVHKGQVEQLKLYVEELKERATVLQSKLDSREQVYYNQRRGAFFYIEGDPIPKDFHELYTEMDCVAIDNVIARSMTKDPKAVKNMEKEIKIMKFLMYVTLGCAGLAVVLGIMIKTDLQTIAQNIGVTLTL